MNVYAIVIFNVFLFAFPACTIIVDELSAEAFTATGFPVG